MTFSELLEYTNPDEAFYQEACEISKAAEEMRADPNIWLDLFETEMMRTAVRKNLIDLNIVNVLADIIVDYFLKSKNEQKLAILAMPVKVPEKNYDPKERKQNQAADAKKIITKDEARLTAERKAKSEAKEKQQEAKKPAQMPEKLDDNKQLNSPQYQNPPQSLPSSEEVPQQALPQSPSSQEAERAKAEPSSALSATTFARLGEEESLKGLMGHGII